MTLQELKDRIDKSDIDDFPILFRYSDVPFICYQYINSISNIIKKNIDYLESLDGFGNQRMDIFGESETDENIKCFSADEIESLNFDIRKEKNFYIISKKYSKEVEDKFKDFIVDVPKLQDWQIKDYVYSVANGVDTDELDWLITICKWDIFRIENELDKLRIFEKDERKFLFDSMKCQNAFSDLSSFNVFDITNAITKRDINSLLCCLRDIKSFDADPLGIVTILYNQFRKLIQVWLSPNPIEETTGLKSNVIYAIKKSGRCYNQAQLIDIFKFLSSIDKELKTGHIDMSWLIDYIICRCLIFCFNI